MHVLLIKKMKSVTLILVVLVLVLSSITILATGRSANAHFFGGSTKDVGDGYQIVFVPFPETPIAGSNDTRLNFSILREGQNINNVNVAFTIKVKDSDTFEGQFPFKWYEFSDITIPYVFEKASYYVVNVQAAVAGGAESQSRLFAVDFDLRVKDQHEIVSPDLLPFVIVIPGAVVGIIGGLFLYRRRSAAARQTSHS